MNDRIGQLETAVGALLATESSPSPNRIRELINMMRETPMGAGVTDDEAEFLAREFEERHGVTMTIGAVLTETEYEPWLQSMLPSITPYYWERYEKLLIEKKYSSQVIATMDEVTDRVLGLLENPTKEEPFDRRGMVVGHVQSGKTANYIGLLCKAADAGYKVIIVIAGLQNILRNQTQERIDEGFVGRDSALLLSKKRNKTVGVGRFDQQRRPATFTNTKRDFNKDTADVVGIDIKSLKEPVVVVIKKNHNTLNNLLQWLKDNNASATGDTIDQPMLVIDDEADNASINTSHGQEEVTRINGQIRDLLSMSQRSCYVGYTATPFANIFIDPNTDHDMFNEDLFPKSFIVSLDPPTNYFGPSKVFLDEETDHVRHIDDNADLLPLRHRIDHELTSLPDSLKDAIRTFIVARAIRLARNQVNEHNSMLVNASRFTRIQGQMRNEIHIFLNNIIASIRVNGALDKKTSMSDPVIKDLYETWKREYDHLEVGWDDIQVNLLEASASTSVIEINSNSSGKLDYSEHEKTGLNVIAVGGFALSRGLTLEGLSISYILRNSMMYDTLMQMGRWFGYRPGYEDLCRIWMPEEAEGWYEHISESVNELRDELRSMEASNATPTEFGLKVRSHPDTLLITARNKIGYGELLRVDVSLSNKFIETFAIRNDKTSIDSNMAAVQQLLASLKSSGSYLDDVERTSSGHLIKNAPVKPVVNFITSYRNHPDSLKTESDPVRRYIEQRQEAEFKHWDILFTSLSDENTNESYPDLDIPIKPQVRTAGNASGNGKLLISNKQRFSSRGVEKNGLSSADIDYVEKNYMPESDSIRNRAHRTNINYPDRIYRAIRKRPLLIVHLLKINPAEEVNSPIPVAEPVVAWSISFPKTGTEEQLTEYVVSRTWMDEFARQYRDEAQEEEMIGDE